MKIKNKHLLKLKKAKELVNLLEQQFNESIDMPVNEISTGIIDDTIFYFYKDEAIAMSVNGTVMMTIQGLLRFHPSNRFVVVDMGAIRFVTNGADVMAPGIVDADEQIDVGMPVWICDEQHHKPLAIGIALMNGTEMVQASKGKAVKMIHYVGDPIWNSIDSS